MRFIAHFDRANAIGNPIDVSSEITLNSFREIKVHSETLKFTLNLIFSNKIIGIERN